MLANDYPILALIIKQPKPSYVRTTPLALPALPALPALSTCPPANLTLTSTQLQARMCMLNHACSEACVAHTDRYMHMHAYVRECAHTCSSAHVRTHMHTLVCTYVHTHQQIWSGELLLAPDSDAETNSPHLHPCIQS